MSTGAYVPEGLGVSDMGETLMVGKRFPFIADRFRPAKTEEKN
jgi:hypothetical protein